MFQRNGSIARTEYNILLMYLTGNYCAYSIGMHRSRTKHVGDDVHFIQVEIEANKTIQLVYCQTLKMVADNLTKALPYALFAKFA